VKTGCVAISKNGFIGGTRFEVEYAVSLGIPVHVHWENGLSEWIFQHSFPFSDGKKEFFLAWEGFFRLHPKLSKVETPQNQMNTGFEHHSHRPEFYWDLCRDIQIADREENHINKSRQTTKSTGPIFYNPDDSVQTLGFSVCYGFLNKGQNTMHMLSEHFDEIPDGFKTAFECRSAPTLDKAFCGPGSPIFPELLKFIFKDPGSMDPAITLAKGVEDTRVLFGSMGRVHEKEPAKPSEHFTFMVRSLSPLLLADLIDSLVEGLNDMEAVQDQRGVRAVLLDSANVCCAHVTARP
jgi:hypothetical protein